MARHNDGFFRTILKGAVAQGWKVENTKGGHIKFTPPGEGSIIIASSTPGDERGVKNFLSQMKRSGYRP